MLESYQLNELTNGAYGLTKRQARLDQYTSFRIGGPCELLIEPTSEKELLRTIRYLQAESLPYYLLGNGSNVLVRDGGFPGVIVVLGRLFSDFSIDGVSVTAQAGTALHDLAEASFRAGLTGLEELSGIPGTVGGGVMMNAGAYGKEMKDVVRSVRAINRAGKLVELTIEEMAMGYRRSRMMEEGMIVVQVTFSLQEDAPEKILARYQDFSQRRAEKQPLDRYSAGSTFKRPAEGYASALIDQAGLRGFSYGQAQVSEKHCGFLINQGQASAREMLTLIDLVQKRVREKFAIDLEPEVRIIGVDVEENASSGHKLQ